MNFFKLGFLSVVFFVNLHAEKALICGVCRSIEKVFPTTVMQMEKMGLLFDDFRILIYENNSKDRTKELLYAWAKKNPKVWFKTETLTRVDQSNLTVNSIFGFGSTRVEKIARARNIVLQKALSKEYDDFDYIIWYDMDFQEPFAMDGMIEVIQSEKEWDAVFANGLIDSDKRYWDKYAFRNEAFLFGPELLGSIFWEEMPLFNYHFDEEGPWIPVFSAFSGLGIYKREALKGCRYSPFVDDQLETFYLQLLEEGELKGWEGIHTLSKAKEKIKTVVYVDGPSKNLPRRSNTIGFMKDQKSRLIWHLANDQERYPVVCEHVYLHALMTLNGHSKFFINPRLKLIYQAN